MKEFRIAAEAFIMMDVRAETAEEAEATAKDALNHVLGEGLPLDDPDFDYVMPAYNKGCIVHIEDETEVEDETEEDDVD